MSFVHEVPPDVEERFFEHAALVETGVSAAVKMHRAKHEGDGYEQGSVEAAQSELGDSVMVLGMVLALVARRWGQSLPNIVSTVFTVAEMAEKQYAADADGSS